MSIDQSSDKEPNQQVARIHQVYGRATQVTVWLETVPTAGRAFATFSALSDNTAAHWNPEARPNKRCCRHHNDFSKLRKPAHSTMVWTSLDSARGCARKILEICLWRVRARRAKAL
jgi:hypothetical protein